MGGTVEEGTIRVLLVGITEDLGSELEVEGFDVTSIPDLSSLGPGTDHDAVVVALGELGPLEALETLRLKTPAAAILVVTSPDREADGAVALHAGAEDHLVAGRIVHGLLPRAIRYAVERRRLRRQLSTVDELTRLPNLRGFVSIAEHHLRMADRTGTPTVLLFLRLDGYEDVVASLGSTGADDLVRDAAEVLLTAIREADLPARIAPDTFCVLLSGEASGAEVTVLSRLVEAIALHDTVKPDPGPLALSVGTALYDPATPVGLERLLETAQAGLQADPSGAR